MKALGKDILTPAGFGLLVAALLVTPSSLGEESDADRRKPACLLIEPVICRSSEGNEPAVSRLDRKAIESVYAQANIRIAWLQPRYLDHTAARDGTANWKRLAEIGKERGLWETGPIRLSLVFVNTINGKPGHADWAPLTAGPGGHSDRAGQSASSLCRRNKGIR